MWRWTVGMVVAAGSSVGCGPEAFDRTSYELGSVAGVLCSNSLAVRERVLPQRTNSGLALAYPLLFFNQGTQTASLNLGGAVATLDGEPERVAVRCSEHGYLPSASLSLQPGQRVRIDCQLTLTAAGLASARAGDSELRLEVPVLSEGRLLPASFTYRVKLEDAS